MMCPKCGRSGVCRVIDSRENKDGTYRRRECTMCGTRFSTMETRIKGRKVRKKDVPGGSGLHCPAGK
jgi:transcriptional regulator NrdR family protein